MVIKKETSNELRKKIITAFQKGHGNREISEILDVNFKTVAGIIKIFSETGRIEKKLRGGVRNQKLNSLIKNSIMTWVDEDCSLTLKKLKIRVFEEFSKTVSLKTIDRVLIEFSYSFKNITLIPARRNDEEVILARQIYSAFFMDLVSREDEENIIFVDEVGFSVSMRCRKGRSKKNMPANMVLTSLRSRNISVCAACNKSELILYKSRTSAYNTASFIEFINILIDTLIVKGKKNSIFVFDNVAFHRSSSVGEIILSRGFRFKLLPAYSPFLNPIENLFSKWKLGVKQANVMNEEQLMAVIENSSHSITNNDCKGFYKNMMGFLSLCLQRIEILNGN